MEVRREVLDEVRRDIEEARRLVREPDPRVHREEIERLLARAEERLR